MQAVGRGDGDHLKVALFQHLAVIGEDSRNAEPFCQRRSIAGSRRGDGKHFRLMRHDLQGRGVNVRLELRADDADLYFAVRHFRLCLKNPIEHCQAGGPATSLDRKSTRLNSSHGYISYAVFCLKKKTRRHSSRSGYMSSGGCPLPHRWRRPSPWLRPAPRPRRRERDSTCTYPPAPTTRISPSRT